MPSPSCASNARTALCETSGVEFNSATCALLAQVLPVFLLIVAVSNGTTGRALHQAAKSWREGSAWAVLLGIGLAGLGVLAELVFVLGAGRPSGMPPGAGWFAMAVFVLYLILAMVELSFRLLASESSG